MDWLSVVAFVLLAAGHTTLWVTFVNRTHAWPLPCATLRRIRHLHDMAIPLFPIALVWFVGLQGPMLLRGGSWRGVTLFWGVLFAICGVGALRLAFVILRNLLSRLPAQLLSNHSEFFDISRELGYKPVGPGPYALLARVPFNEQTRLEFNEKTLVLPRLPREWDGLTVLHLSDWHFAGTITKDYFVKVAEIISRRPVDLVCFTGDLLDNQSLVAWLPDTLGRLQGRLGNLFILGNHDWYQHPEEIRTAVESLGWINVASRTITLNLQGKTLEIGGDETPWLGTTPAFNAATDFRMLLCHTPDHIHRVRRDNVDLMLSGHNHGGQVRLPGIGAVYSPSKYGCKYAGGTYWEPPTLLHVSRGLSGCHPLRWRCQPEVSRLVLRAPGP